MAGSFRFEEERRSRGPSTPATVILPKSAATVVMPPMTRSAATVVLPEDVPTGTGTRRKTGTPAVTAAAVDMSTVTEEDIIEESTANGGGGGGGGGGYDWLEEETTAPSKPAPVGLLLLGLAGLAAWAWR